MTNSQDYWVSPGAVRYTSKQICLFLLPNLPELEIGEWPIKPRKSGYSTAIINAPRIAKEYAGFVPAVEVAAELTARMAHLPPPAAAAMLAIYGHDENYQDYARTHNFTDHGLRQLLRDAIDYCAGEQRKMQTYAAWQADRGALKLARSIQSPAPGK